MQSHPAVSAEQENMRWKAPSQRVTGQSDLLAPPPGIRVGVGANIRILGSCRECRAFHTSRGSIREEKDPAIHMPGLRKGILLGGTHPATGGLAKVNAELVRSAAALHNLAAHNQSHTQQSRPHKCQ